MQKIAHPSMTRGQMFNLSGSSTQYTLHWTELEADLFQGSSIGAIVVSPRAKTNETQNVLICNLSAGWGTAALSMHTIDGGTSRVSSKVINGDKHHTVPGSIKLTNVPVNQATDVDADINIGYHLPDYP